MLSERLTSRLCRLLQEHYQASSFKLDYLEAWTGQRGRQISQSTISRVLNGKVRRIQRATAEQLAAFLEAETGGRLKAADVLGEGAPRKRRKRSVRHPISTVAGDGTFDYNGDDIPARQAHLFRPCGICLDATGVLYIADSLNHRIRAIDRRGAISTVAGSGTDRSTTFSGDGGLASNALLFEPNGVAVDGAGDVYIADTLNNRVRKVDAESRGISTVAGNGEAGFSGDGGPAVEAALNKPVDILVDGAGHVYFSDSHNARVRRIDGDCGIISTVAGSGAIGDAGDGGPAVDVQFYGPHGLALATNGDLYIVDMYNNRVCKADAITGILTTLAGTGDAGFTGDGGLATQAQFNRPDGIAVDGAGHLFVSDSHNHRVRKVDAATGVVTTVAGTGVIGYNEDGIAATAAHLNGPRGLCFNAAGDLYIADVFGSRVRKVAGVGVPRV